MNNVTLMIITKNDDEFDPVLLITHAEAKTSQHLGPQSYFIE